MEPAVITHAPPRSRPKRPKTTSATSTIAEISKTVRRNSAVLR